MIARSPSGAPTAAGLYDPATERDACGLASVVSLTGEPSHDIVRLALEALENLEHRGAIGSDAGTGDGAGILSDLPDEFIRGELAAHEPALTLPPLGGYAAGLAFLPRASTERQAVKYRIAAIAAEEGLAVLTWRAVAVRPDVLGGSARDAAPVIEQLIVVPATGTALHTDLLERRAFRTRKRIQHETGCYLPSFSARTIVYKGMVTTLQLPGFYPELSDERFASRFAIVHSRYSTNTFPSWHLAQPLRMVAHNGEINTVRGNRNWMRAREAQLESEALGDVRQLLPICSDGGSDSASFDEVLELLVMAGRTLPHALSMMVPEAWESETGLALELVDFLEYHSLLMEPWDGPAAMIATDGSELVALLDRNGLRPGRYLVTTDGLLVIASETGVLDVAPERVAHRGRLQPGRMLAVNLATGEIRDDEAVKRELAESAPWGEWLEQGRIRLSEQPEREHLVHPPASINRRQRTFGYTEEELRLVLTPMARDGIEPLAAMGTDTPIAALSEKPRHLHDYFVQQFAQVTNPPLDALREELVTSLRAGMGPQENLLTQSAAHARQVILDFPVIDNDALARIQHFGDDPLRERAVTIRGLYPVDFEAKGLADRLEAMCNEASAAIEAGAEFIIISDRDSNKDLAPVPSLLAVSAVHHHLIREGLRMRVALIAESGDVREVHHVAALIGYGAAAVNPYLAMETVSLLVRDGSIPGITETEAIARLIKALGKGMLKVMSKMGISTVASYSGAQTFEAIGLAQPLVDRYFTGTASRLGGVGLDVLAAEVAARHRAAYPDDPAALAHKRLETGGEYRWRRGEEPHLFDPQTIYKLQHATRTGRREIFSEYTARVNEQQERLMTLRGLFSFAPQRPAVPLGEVEPVSEIVRRFATGAMSYGSISPEAHETLAIAMNQLGGRSNTGEGGESEERLLDPARRSAIKQVASGRFGVTSLYLTSADEIQIKLAQGAKPGEGGQLPPTKMYPWIARTRHATPGVGLISPPPHHDIYSIEDLKQLIFDLKRANPAARISTKLVAQSGIGPVAAGVAKALSDVILISGHDGGTGASPMNSLKHAGSPWELGLAEAQQTLMLNGLRERVVLQADGQLKTGRDVVIAALLGAEEFGFATAPLVVSGCIMMRVCHLDTCPVGVATQNPELRERFTGQAAHVVNFFRFIAEEVREILAGLGYRSIAEAVGDTSALDVADAITHWKAAGLDLTPVLRGPEFAADEPRRHGREQDHELGAHFDVQLIDMAADALDAREPVVIDLPIRNVDRAVGTMLGHETTKRHGAAGLAPGTIDVTLTGSAGQSLGAFLPAGISLRLVGDANDYVGKGLSGGEISIRPHPRAGHAAAGNVIAGNVIGYGATAGELWIAGVVGERFLVRGSGATAVVEGTGDHALEYFTGGFALILGATGRNIGAGMSGGEAVILDLDPANVNAAERASGALLLQRLGGAGGPGDADPVPAGDADELRARIRTLLQRHAEQTGSELAATLLAELAADPERLFARFTRLIPRGYSRVLEIRERAHAQGVDPDGDRVWTEILEATHG
ncbi:glutamate synthase large subunit [Leucobacter luti]|uniref:Glutamate synthase (NADH) large subunit n=1 Tax=Leucobacter luti TaxID=340320 RepID=A0A4Q7TKA5_9MICO|nr:glutamate synthase large subunit [Leucobacter luti]MBL3700241.1 glutamate synthase large subunit [Leucobacter luti]RZT61035.1 glutamate synthase (NADH) large subunit [Leucobacter luti]